MSSLFVSDEVDETVIKVKTEPGLEIDYENTEIDKDTKGKEKESDIKMKYYNDEESDDEESDNDDDDYIIDTIPVHLNANIKDGSLAPILLQFPTKSSNSHLTENNLSELHKLKIKPESGVIELRLPLNTDNFFSEIISEKFNIKEQILRGVIIHDEPIGNLNDGNIPSLSLISNKENKDQKENKNKNEVSATKFLNSLNANTNSLSSIRTQPGSVGGSRYLIGIQDEKGGLHLTPLSDTCMLRPHFTYIDQTRMSKLERERELQRELNSENNNSNSNNNNNGNSKDENEEKKKNVSVVTMSAKSTKENIPRLGGALLSAKLENEEEGKEFKVIKCDKEFINKHFIENSGNLLNSKLSQNEYLDLLLNQTKL
ncbi:hypothetical protein C6P40_005213 [Pichia californica]|uniref:Uncharacterized protein n=1 Tax=Pichia californica TaxID=460514 RepID=A0A9P6WP93_9ASCO|nr:hypothetical protein C6P42_001203 [[Candida] californica]KAG0689318.1 hypothetical protein C6P40_005213 [[Candida] californica]